MLKASDALDTFGFQWMPPDLVDDIRSLLKLEEVKQQPIEAVIAVHRKESLREFSQRRIHNLRLRVVQTVAKMLHRTGIEWNCFFTPSADASKVIDLFNALQISREKWLNENSLEENIGSPAMEIIRKNFQNHSNFCKWLLEALDGRAGWGKSRCEEGESKDMKMIAEEFKLITQSTDMKVFLRKIGLPGDSYRNDCWPQTLWLTQRINAQKKLIALKQTAEMDTRFGSMTTLHQWIETERDEKLQHLIMNRNESGRFLAAALADARIVLAPELTKYIERNLLQYPHEKVWPMDYDLSFPMQRNDMPNPWARVCSVIDTDQRQGKHREYSKDPAVLNAVQALADFLWKYDGLTFCERIDWCKTPDDFERLFKILKIDNNQWKNKHWLREQSQRPLEEGGVNKDFQDLVIALELRFLGFDEFISWMQSKSTLRTYILQRMRSCKNRGEFLSICANDLNLHNDVWKSELWLLQRSRLLPTERGVGIDLSALVEAVEEHPNISVFGMPEGSSYQTFVDAIDGTITNLDQAMDVFVLASERLGIPLTELLVDENRILIEKDPRLRQAKNFLLGS